MKRALIGLLIVLAIGAGAGAYYIRRGGPELSVNTSPITRGDIVDTVGASGTLQAVTTVQVGSQVSGNISYLGADFNSIVKKGQVIAKLDPSLFDAQLQQARANLPQTRANLTKSQSDLERAKVMLTDAQQKYTRAKELAAKQLAAPERSRRRRRSPSTARDASLAVGAGHRHADAGRGQPVAGDGQSEPGQPRSHDHRGADRRHHHPALASTSARRSPRACRRRRCSSSPPT